MNHFATPLSVLPLFFLDLQTTGPNPQSGRVLELGFGDLKRTESYMVSANEGEEIPRRIRLITGVTEEEILNAESADEVRERLRLFLKNAGKTFAIIHYAKFEIPFLDSFLSENFPKFRILCTFEIARRLLPNLPARGIKGLAGYFGAPGDEFKRARSQIDATRIIWVGLLKLLADRGITTLPELDDFLLTPIPKKTHHEYLMAKEKRLALPKKPGIYRMLGKSGEVLYVGKATSLRDRVNSYFRGRKGRDGRKLEMLTQVYDLETVSCETPLEAALLETDEIKRLNPPYNVSLKKGQRKLAFYSRDFSSVSESDDGAHPIGPFGSAFVIELPLKIVQYLLSKKTSISGTLAIPTFPKDLFYEPIDPKLLESGYRIFQERQGFSLDSILSNRKALATGLSLLRKKRKEEKMNQQATGSENEEGTDEATKESPVETTKDIPETPESVAEKFERTFRGFAEAYLRSKAISSLLNSDLKLPYKKRKLLILSVRKGKVAMTYLDSPPTSSSDHKPLYRRLHLQEHKGKWDSLDIVDYDRMTVLRSEIERLNAQIKLYF